MTATAGYILLTFAMAHFGAGGVGESGQIAVGDLVVSGRYDTKAECVAVLRAVPNPRLGFCVSAEYFKP